MKLIHCADLHLDSKMLTNFSKDMARERRNEILNTFVRMVEYASLESVEAILICGDLFDSNNISALSRNTVMNSVINHPEISFFYLKGNHDFDNLFSSYNDIPDNLIMFDDKWSSYVLGERDLVYVYATELSKENAQTVYNDLKPNPCKINIVMLHGQEGESDSKDKTENINLKFLKNKGISYLALGHIHSYKCDRLDESSDYCYSGCLEGRGFDEPGEHGFVLIDIDEETGILSHSFVPFAKRKIYVIDADVTGCENTPMILERVKQSIALKQPSKDDLVKVVLTGTVPAECERDLVFISKSLEDEFYCLRISDESKICFDPHDYINDISLKGEFVRNVFSSEDINEDEKKEIIEIGLTLLRGGSL